MKQSIRHVVVVLACIFLLQACSEPPTASPVGVSFISFADSKRTAWESNAPRPLETVLWFPAETGTPTEDWRAGFLLAGPHAFHASLPKTPQKFPLILLSHGTGGSAQSMAWFARGLAEAGYIVAAVNHHGNTAVEPKYLPQGFALWWERARDLSVLLDKLIADPAFGPRIDMNRVGVAGFSLGGYTALMLAGARTDYAQWQHYCDKAPSDSSCKLTAEADFGMDKMKRVLDTDARARASLARAGDNYRDERVRAAFAMAPVLALAFDKASLAHISIPVSMLVGENDDQAPPLSNAALLATQIPMAQLHEIKNGTHYMFIARCTLLGKVLHFQICTDPWTLTRSQVHHDTVAQAVAFFSVKLAP